MEDKSYFRNIHLCKLLQVGIKSPSLVKISCSSWQGGGKGKKHLHKGKIMPVFKQIKEGGNFFCMLIVNCLQLNIIPMSKWHIVRLHILIFRLTQLSKTGLPKHLVMQLALFSWCVHHNLTKAVSINHVSPQKCRLLNHLSSLSLEILIRIVNNHSR